MEPMINVALKAARKAGEVIESAFERLDLVNVEEKGRNATVDVVYDYHDVAYPIASWL